MSEFSISISTLDFLINCLAFLLQDFQVPSDLNSSP